MVIEQIRVIKSGRKELRQFGITLGIILGLWGGALLLRGKAYYPYFFIAAVTFLLLGLAVPTLLKPIQKIWISLAVIIGWMVTRLLLMALFYLVVTPLAILSRMFGKRFLDTELDEHLDTYWIARAPAKFEKEAYEKQF